MKAIFLALMLLVAGCNAFADLDSYPGLANRLKSYYMYEKSGAWEQAYEFRPPAFRRTVPLQAYLSAMKEDSADWQLKDFKILGVEKRGNKVYVHMEFTEEGPANYFPKELLAQNQQQLHESGRARLRIKGTSVWMQLNEEWYVYDAVSRMHLSSNHPAVAE